ncbi:MAG: YicC/YloC family endoribonuclease, partial [Acidobacteriaceae bacterium]
MAAGSISTVRSMTGFAQVACAAREGEQVPGFVITLKSVNHRFLDLHLRLPSDADGLEMKVRRALKEKLARGHVEFTLSLEGDAEQSTRINRDIVGNYVQAFRQAA